MNPNDVHENEKPDAPADDDASENANERAAADTAAETPDEAASDPQQSLEEIRDKLLRAVAEADNVRKQAAKEIADSRKYAVSSLARDLLSVADNFERALNALPQAARSQMGEAGQSLLTGVEMIEKELHAVLGRHGVERIATERGEKFDPNVHQAAAQIPSEHPKDTIAEIVQLGWRIGERTLRPAMVAVSAGHPPQPVVATEQTPPGPVPAQETGAESQSNEHATQNEQKEHNEDTST